MLHAAVCVYSTNPPSVIGFVVVLTLNIEHSALKLYGSHNRWNVSMFKSCVTQILSLLEFKNCF